MTDDVDGRNCNIVLLPASFQSEKGAKNINVPVHGLLLSLLSHNSPRSGTNCTMPKMSCSKNGKKRRTDFFSTANAFKKPRRHEGNPPTHYRSLNVDRSQCDKAGGLSLLSSDDGSITSDAGDADDYSATPPASCGWTCARCTFVNSESIHTCEICGFVSSDSPAADSVKGNVMALTFTLFLPSSHRILI